MAYGIVLLGTGGVILLALVVAAWLRALQEYAQRVGTPRHALAEGRVWARDLVVDLEDERETRKREREEARRSLNVRELEDATAEFTLNMTAATARFETVVDDATDTLTRILLPRELPDDSTLVLGGAR